MELLIRAVATAAIVLLVVEFATRAGPVAGGILAGLPIVLGPGYFFLLRDQPPAFVADAALGSLVSLSATQMFLLGYVIASTFFGPPATLALAASAWALSAALLTMFDPGLAVGILLFAVAMGTARMLGRRFVGTSPLTTRGKPRRLILPRAVAAGLLVSLVSLSSSTLGTSVSGALMAFPIGFSAIGYSLHRDHGATMVARTAHASLYGLISLAVFCVTLFVALTADELFDPTGAFLLSLAMSCLTTMMGFSFTRRRSGR